MMNQPNASFADAMQASGIPMPDALLNQETFTRWGKNNRYSGKLLDEGVYVHDFAEDRDFFWFPETPSLTQEQAQQRKLAIRVQREGAHAARQRDYEEASVRAAVEWAAYSETGESEYLHKKQVEAHGIRFGNGFIVVPVRDVAGKLWSLQRIYDVKYCPDYIQQRGGNKNFFKGGKVTAGFHVIGELVDAAAALVCEGYATGATLHRATGLPVIVVFSAGNLEPVIASISGTYPQLSLTIAADDDCWKDSNTGKEKAQAAAAKHHCKVILPVFLDVATQPTDFNDLALLEGLGAVKAQLVPTPAKMLRALSLDAFLKLELPPREMILAPVIARQGLAMLYAKPGMGKTYVSLSVALAVSTGGSTLSGRWVAEKPRRVLFLDGEMPARMMQERLAALSVPLGDKLPAPDYLRLITPDMQERGIPDLATVEGQQAIEEHLEGVELLIIDNLSSLLRQGKENEAESWVPLQTWLLSLRRREISVLLVHHANKGGGQRGTSKKEDLLDTIVTLKRADDYDPQHGAQFTVQFEKARGFYGDEAKPFDARLVADGAALRWEVHDVEDALLQQALALQGAGLTQREIAKEMGVSASTVNRLLKKAPSSAGGA